MDKIRSRKYTYELFKPSIDTIQSIKTMSCIYHAIVFDKRKNGSVDYMRGFIYFKNPRTVTIVDKIIKKCKITNYKVSVSQDRPHDIHSELKENDDVWEYGSPPIQGGLKPTPIQEQLPDLSTENQDLSRQEIIPVSLQESRVENQEPSQDLAQDLAQEPLRDLVREPSNQMAVFEEIVLRIFEQQTKQLTNVVKDLTEKVEKATITNNTVNNNNTINSNNTINNNTINVFLNEDCKHAITIDKLLEDIIITKADLYEMRQYGLENVMTKRFLHELEQYDITTRPVHCTDLSRESIHVKKASGWVKEVGNKDSNLTTAAREIARKSNCIMLELYDNNPDYSNTATKRFDEGLELHLAVSGNGKPIKSIAEAFQRNIAKKVYINAKMIKEMKH